MKKAKRAYLQVCETQKISYKSSACEFGHLEVVKYLVEQGANIEALRGTGSTPLFVASSNGYLPLSFLF